MLISLLFLNILFLSSCHDNGAYINAGKLSKYSSRKFQVNLSESLNYNYSVFIDCSEFSSHEYIYFKVILHDGEFKDDFIYYSPRNEMYTFLYFELGQPYDSSNSNIRTFQINNPYIIQKKYLNMINLKRIKLNNLKKYEKDLLMFGLILFLAFLKKIMIYMN